MSHRALSPETQRVLKNHGVIAYTPSRMPAIFSFLLTGALFTAALLMSFGHALANDRDDGRYYYDQYALPYVKAYAAPGTYGRSDDGEYWRGSRNTY
ncbi:MAG: hypothetical protein ACSLE4_12575 [Methyloceanibacter sp.]|uniref:hypothetical protein n=1 Tax=Methyloceanibacter sp. TaxID=1965321 RepID=UPI003EE078F6